MDFRDQKVTQTNYPNEVSRSHELSSNQHQMVYLLSTYVRRLLHLNLLLTLCNLFDVTILLSYFMKCTIKLFGMSITGLFLKMFMICDLYLLHVENKLLLYNIILHQRSMLSVTDIKQNNGTCHRNFF